MKDEELHEIGHGGRLMPIEILFFSFNGPAPSLGGDICLSAATLIPHLLLRVLRVSVVNQSLCSFDRLLTPAESRSNPARPPGSTHSTSTCREPAFTSTGWKFTFSTRGAKAERSGTSFSVAVGRQRLAVEENSDDGALRLVNGDQVQRDLAVLVEGKAEFQLRPLLGLPMGDVQPQRQRHRLRLQPAGGDSIFTSSKLTYFAPVAPPRASKSRLGNG